MLTQCNCVVFIYVIISTRLRKPPLGQGSASLSETEYGVIPFAFLHRAGLWSLTFVTLGWMDHCSSKIASSTSGRWRNGSKSTFRKRKTRMWRHGEDYLYSIQSCFLGGTQLYRNLAAGVPIASPSRDALGCTAEFIRRCAIKYNYIRLRARAQPIVILVPP